MKIKHIEENIFKIKHNRKIFLVKILNLFESTGVYGNVLYDLANDDIKSYDRPSLNRVYHTFLSNKNYLKDRGTYCNIMYFYDDKIIEFILNNKNYFNNLYNTFKKRKLDELCTVSTK